MSVCCGDCRFTGCHFVQRFGNSPTFVRYQVNFYQIARHHMSFDGTSLLVTNTSKQATMQQCFGVSASRGFFFLFLCPLEVLMFPLNSACASNAARDCEVGRVKKPICMFWRSCSTVGDKYEKKTALIPQLRIGSPSFLTLCETY